MALWNRVWSKWSWSMPFLQGSTFYQHSLVNQQSKSDNRQILKKNPITAQFIVHFTILFYGVIHLIKCSMAMFHTALWYPLLNERSRLKLTISSWHEQLEAGLGNDLRCVSVQLPERQVQFVRLCGERKVGLRSVKPFPLVIQKDKTRLCLHGLFCFSVRLLVSSGASTLYFKQNHGILCTWSGWKITFSWRIMSFPCLSHVVWEEQIHDSHQHYSQAWNSPNREPATWHLGCSTFRLNGSIWC